MNSSKPSDRELDSIFQLNGLSIVVKEILRGWFNIRDFLVGAGFSKTRLSKFEPISEEERVYLNDMLKKFESKFQEEPEFLEATKQQSSESISYHRAVFQSVRLSGERKGHTLTFPFSLFIECRYNEDSPFLQMIIRDLVRFPVLRQLPSFIDHFLVCRGKTRVPRSPLAVKYVQALADPHYGSTQHGFPTQAGVAEDIGCSERTIHNLQNTYSYLAVITPRYLANMGKLGFRCVRITHKDPLNSELLPFTLRTALLDRNELVSVLYLPPVSIKTESIPLDNFFDLTTYQIARNFEQLHARPEKSWQWPIRLLGEYTERISPSQKGIYFSLEPMVEPTPRPLVDFQIIDQVQLVSDTYENLAHAVGISEAYMKKRLTTLLSDEIIAPFYFITRIGLTATVLVTYEGSETETRNFVNNLLAYPYVELFSGPKGGLASVGLPPSWTPVFLDDLLHLRRSGMDVWGMMVAPVIARWGIPLAAMARKEEFFGIVWKTDGEELATGDENIS